MSANNPPVYEKLSQEIEVVCPTCSIKKNIKVPIQARAKKDGIYILSIPVGVICKHSFQVFLDKNLWVRGYQRVDLEIRNIEYVESELKKENEQAVDVSLLFQQLIKQLRLVVDDKEILGTGLFSIDGRIIYSSIPQNALFNTIRELQLRNETDMPEILKLMIELKTHQKVYAEILEIGDEKYILILFFSRLVNFTLGSQIMKEFSHRIKNMIERPG